MSEYTFFTPVLSTYALLVASVGSVGFDGTVILLFDFLLTTFDAVFSAVSSFVTYLFPALGDHPVPARAAFSPAVGILGSLSPTAMGFAGSTGALESFVLPAVEVVAFV